MEFTHGQILYTSIYFNDNLNSEVTWVKFGQKIVLILWFIQRGNIFLH